MKKIGEYKSRLAALKTSSAGSLEACRSLQEQLRELKREVLAQLLALRGEVWEKARKSVQSRPLLGDRGKEGAKRLLGDVQERVMGLFDDDGAAEVEAWAEINQEIDARLDRLAALEHQLSRAVEKPETALPPRTEHRDESGDDLYAAVGAAVRKGHRSGFCSHCGKGVEPEDRFCRHCGHRLR